jgi:hypothetical protein
MYDVVCWAGDIYILHIIIETLYNRHTLCIVDNQAALWSFLPSVIFIHEELHYHNYMAITPC